MADFTWFREQTCVVACPYGRWQSVLLDRQSLIVAYDSRRGEPRSHGKERLPGAGDCIDCGACVITCPTGIDIRDGLQMECIHCTQCADACDAIMSRVGRPPGLIRYSSRASLEGERVRRLRPRVVLYPAALSLAFGGFVVALVLRTPADITVMRGMGAPFAVESDGRVANQLRIKITNRDPQSHRYTVSLEGVEPGTMIAPQNPIAVAPGRTEVMDLFVMLPASAFRDGERRITVHIADGAGYTDDVSYRLVGPEHHDVDDSHGTPGKDRR
jgi:cytochrome c oxidase accessory protein FixG